LAEKDVTDLIERLEAFEDRLGVNLEGLFAEVSQDGYANVNGELHLREGTELERDIEVVATIYDSSGRVLAVDDARFDSDSFFGFEAFSLFMEVGNKKPAKIRVYPKAR
jgi:hypothetical protein